MWSCYIGLGLNLAAVASVDLGITSPHSHFPGSSQMEEEDSEVTAQRESQFIAEVQNHTERGHSGVGWLLNTAEGSVSV